MTTDHVSDDRLRLYSVSDGGTELVVLAGELDLGSADSADRALDDALGRGPRMLAMDLQALEFCDCSGLRSLIRARERALEAGADVRVLAPTPQVERLIRLAGCAELLEVGGQPT